MENLVLILQSATDNDWAARNWYHAAHNEINGLARYHGLTTEVSCGIVAALSPRMPWNVNIIEADRVIKGLGSRALGDSIVKARRIIGGESPDNVLGGRKVRSFYRNLFDPRDDYHVTVDIWAARAWYGDLNFNKGITPKQYDIIAADYRALAAVYGIIPSEIQAVIWELARRLKSNKAAIGQLGIDI